VSSPAARTPADYETRRIYGPFHRRTKQGRHPHDLFAEMAESGQLWGRGRIGSPFLAVLASRGHFPKGRAVSNSSRSSSPTLRGDQSRPGMRHLTA
jgi:hypothetical protein